MSANRQQKVWFITGSSTGFGRCLTEYVLSKGQIVVATLRNPANLDDLKANHSAEQLLLVKLDVCQPQEITAAFEKVKSIFGRLDVVVNNAGYGMLAEVEGTPEDVARRLFDVNFWGATNVSRAAVKFFREVNKPGAGGRLINISSVASLRPFSPAAFYSASKSALEAFTQVLAQEVDPEWNIKVSLIEPGGFNTDAFKNSAKVPMHPAYNKPGLPSVEVRKMFSPDIDYGDPKKAVEKWYELAELADPPMRLLLGRDVASLARAQIDELLQDVNAREDWSDNLAYSRPARI